MTGRRALVCTPLMPEYDREGGSRRAFHLIVALRDAGWAVSLIAHNSARGERYARVLRNMGVATYAGPQSQRVGDEFLRQPEHLLRAAHFDLALISSWPIAEFYLPLIRSHSPGTKVIVDSVDLHFLRRSRSVFLGSDGGRPSPSLSTAFADEMMREVNVYAGADAVLTVSAKEAALVNDMLANPGHARVVPDMEDLPASELPFSERRGMVFIGNFRHPPNLQAVEYLCGSILPRLGATISAAHPVSLVGNDLNATIRDYARGMHHVRMVGWVPSVLPYLQQSRVSLVPLLHGAGTKRKLIQALMVGTPSVSTSVGVEGLGLQDGEHILLADDPATFASESERLLCDDCLWNRLAGNGIAWARAAHDPVAIRERFLSIISELTATSGPRSVRAELGNSGLPEQPI